MNRNIVESYSLKSPCSSYNWVRYCSLTIIPTGKHHLNTLRIWKVALYCLVLSPTGIDRASSVQKQVMTVLDKEDQDLLAALDVSVEKARGHIVSLQAARASLWQTQMPKTLAALGISPSEYEHHLLYDGKVTAEPYLPAWNNSIWVRSVWIPFESIC